jgi:hypothetical protein
LALGGLSVQAELITTPLDFEDVLTPNRNGIYAEAGVSGFCNGGTSDAVGSANGPDCDTICDDQSVAARFARSATIGGSLELFAEPRSGGRSSGRLARCSQMAGCALNLPAGKTSAAVAPP